MIEKRKISALLTAFILLITLFTGCAVEVKPSENKPSTSDYLQQVDLSIVGVGLGLPTSAGDEALIRQFEKESGTRVIIKRTAAGQDEASYLNYLDLLVNSDGLPDLIMFPSFADTYQKQYLYRLNDYLKEDEQFQELPQPLVAAVTVSDSIYALPLRYKMEGYFIRTADLKKQGLSVPSFGLSFTRFFSTIKTLAKAGLVPAQALYQIPYWYPASQKDDFAWCGYQNKAFRFTDPVFRDGVSYANQLYAACPEQVSATPAIRYDSTQNLAALKQAGFDAYLGIPGGKSVIDANYVGITRQSGHKKEAFALARFLSHHPDGIQSRITAHADELTGIFPAARSAKLLSGLSWYSFTGLSDAADAIDEAFMLGGDILPEYQAAIEKRFLLSHDKTKVYSLEEVLRLAVSGELTFAKYAAELEEAIME